ncbi:MAG: hypothetical protein ACYC90_14000 [Candidatus Nanopelagicales bacterium]
MTSTVSSLMPAHRVIECTHSGAVTAADMRTSAKGMRDLAERDGVWNVLSDFTDATAVPRGTDMLAMMEQLQAAGVTAQLRHAMVWPSDMQVRMAYEVWKTAEQNRGFHAQAFYSRDEAIAWLDA